MVLTQIRLSEQALDLSLSTAKIADLAVTTGKINDLAVTSGKIGPGAVIIDKLADFRPSAGTGPLQLAVAAGKIRVDNVISTYAGTLILDLTDDATNYVESTNAGVVSANVVGYTTGYYPIATVVTATGVISSITDVRTVVEVNPFDSNNYVVGTQVIREDASGDGLDLNGIDLVFTLANVPVIAGSEEVYLNGVLQQSGGADYAIVPSTGVITMTDAPVSTDRVLVSYRY